MRTFLNNKIRICENSKLYLFAEFYRNILNAFNKCTLDQFKDLINFNIECSNAYFINSLLELKHHKALN